MQSDLIGNKTIGVIGYGNFGQVVCNIFFSHNSVMLYSQTAHQSELAKHIVHVATLDELILQSDIIIPCVPIRNFREIIQKISGIIKPDTIIMDICSIMEYPVRIMQELLPAYVEIIASHPMFGPNSLLELKGKLTDLPIVFHNISAVEKNYDGIKHYFADLGLRIIEITPAEHDKLSAESHFFSMLTGELVRDLHLQPTSIDTPGTRALFHAMQFTGADKHIIEDMITYNKYCKPLLQKVLHLLQQLEKGTIYE